MYHPHRAGTDSPVPAADEWRRDAMRDAGFYAQKSGSPTGFALVVLLHVAVLSALILIKGPAFIRTVHPPLVVHMIEVEPEPEVIPPPDPQPLRQQQSVIDHVE